MRGIKKSYTKVVGIDLPNQAKTWELLHFSKINSWFLLVIIIVANLKRYQLRVLTQTTW